jgi:hypothetical protein
MANKTQALALFRNLLRQSSKLQNYNFRDHAMRRVKGSFQEAKALDAEAAATQYAWGLEQLKLVERYKVLGELYPDDLPNVMSKKND